MKHSTYRRLLLLALGVWCAPVAGCAQKPPATTQLMMRGSSEADPVGSIIERRPELALADTQVTDLREVKHELERRNQPLRDQLDGLGYGNIDPRRRERPTKEQEERAKPILEQYRENNRKAREAALKLLTEAQRIKLDSLMKRARPDSGQTRRAR